MPGITKSSVDDSVSRSVVDNHGGPCILICRLQPEYHQLIIPALKTAKVMVLCWTFGV